MITAINWFEIPVTDMDRAVKFYESVLDVKLAVIDFGGLPMAMFDGERSGGCLVQGEGYTPAAQGTMIYLNCNPDLQHALERVEAAGGEIVAPKTDIGQGNGWMAFIMDSEGNKIGLHSNE